MLPDTIATASPEDFDSFLMFVRLGERILLTLFFVVAASIMMLAYRGKIQEVDLDLSNPAGSLKTTASLAMPVFILLALILYVFVVVSHPLSISSDTRKMSGASFPQEDVSAERQSRRTSAFLGYGAGEDGQRMLTSDLDAVIVAAEQLRRLSNRFPESDAARIAEVVDRLGGGAVGLTQMRDELLLDKFGPQIMETCMPTRLALMNLNTSDQCVAFNTYLSR